MVCNSRLGINIQFFSERDSVLRQLVEKEADIEELTNQMNKTTAQLQLDLELLRERYRFRSVDACLRKYLS